MSFLRKQESSGYSWVPAFAGTTVQGTAMMMAKMFPKAYPSRDQPEFIFDNCCIIGSIANLITIEQARNYNILVSFWSHSKVGIPVTAVSILIALGWVFMVG